MASGRIVLPNSVSVGFRFHPTDEEIVSHFLKNKMLGNDHLVQLIREVDVCNHEPWELPNFSVVDSDDPEWFFFSTRDFKYFHGRRSNRATRKGYWKATGKDRKIKARRTKNVIGTKKTLVFYKGRVPNGVRTNWVMHEYHSVDNYSQKTQYVVCRLKNKDDEKVDNVDSGLQSRAMPVPEVSPEENGGLLFTPPLQEANSELLCSSAHLDWEDETELDEFVTSLIGNGEDIDFVNSVIVNGEEYHDEETADPFGNLFIQAQCSGPIHLEGAMLSREAQFEATGSRLSWSDQPQMPMMRKSRGSMSESKHFQYEQGNIYRCNEFSGPDISGESTDDIRRRNRILETNAPLKRMFPKTEYEERHINPLSDQRAVSRIRLQRRIENTAVNPIKAEKVSKYTSGDYREDNEICTRPPSEYFANVIVGLILFIMFVREMVLYGEWGI